jgi:hypothetical protein
MAAIGGVEVLDLGFVAQEAITKYRFVKANGTRGIDMADTAGEKCLGVAQHDVSSADAAEGAHCNVRLEGISVVEAGGTVTLGADVQADATARAVDAASADVVLGVALQGTSTAGDLIPILLAGAGQHVLA